MAGQSITLTCDQSLASSSSMLSVTYKTFENSGVLPGSSIFIGQYLFSGSETSSAHLSVQQVGSAVEQHFSQHVAGTSAPLSCAVACLPVR